MRSLRVLLLFPICCGLGFAQVQATVMNGYASNWSSPALGAIPFIPLTQTPEISLDQPILGNRRSRG